MSESAWPDAYAPIIEALRDSLSPRGIDQWLNASNRYLKGQRPVDLLTQRRYETVLEAAYAFRDEAYI